MLEKQKTRMLKYQTELDGDVALLIRYSEVKSFQNLSETSM